MKKYLIAAIIIAFIMVFTGCGGGPDPVQDDPAGTGTQGTGTTGGGTQGTGTTGGGTVGGGTAGTDTVGTGTQGTGSGAPAGTTGTGTQGTGTVGTGTAGTGTQGTGTVGTGTGTGTAGTGTQGTGTQGTGTAGTGTAGTGAAGSHRDIILDGATNYTVVSGDSLSNIAILRYGAANMYYFPLIRLANAGIVPDPDSIVPGTVLIIPNLQRNLDNGAARAAIRADMLNIAALYDRRGRPNAAAELRSLANTL